MNEIMNSVVFTLWIIVSLVSGLPDMVLYPAVHSVDADTFENKMSEVVVDLTVGSLNKPVARHESVPSIIDIRSEESFEVGHIPGARMSGGKGGRFGISTSELNARCSNRNNILIYSQDGSGYEDVAKVAKQAKKKACYKNIYLLKGGMDEWELSGRDITNEPYDYLDPTRSILLHEKSYPINDFFGRDKLMY